MTKFSRRTRVAATPQSRAHCVLTLHSVHQHGDFSVMNTILKSHHFRAGSADAGVGTLEGPGNGTSQPGVGFCQQNHVFENMAIFDSAGRGYNLSRWGT